MTRERIAHLAAVALGIIAVLAVVLGVGGMIIWDEIQKRQVSNEPVRLENP